MIKLLLEASGLGEAAVRVNTTGSWEKKNSSRYVVAQSSATLLPVVTWKAQQLDLGGKNMPNTFGDLAKDISK